MTAFRSVMNKLYFYLKESIFKNIILCTHILCAIKCCICLKTKKLCFEEASSLEPHQNTSKQGARPKGGLGEAFMIISMDDMTEYSIPIHTVN